MTALAVEPVTREAACHQSGMPDLWTDANPQTDNTTAAAICRSCPARNACLEQAEAQRLRPETLLVTTWRPYGVWGGMLYTGTRRAPVGIVT